MALDSDTSTQDAKMATNGQKEDAVAVSEAGGKAVSFSTDAAGAPVGGVGAGSTSVTSGQQPAASEDADSTAVTSGQQPAASEDEARKMAVIDAGYKRLCSDATLQTKKDGYFMTFDSQVIQSVPESQFEEFKQLKTDEERIFFVWNLPPVHSIIKVRPFCRNKSAKAAEDTKQAGNQLFQQKRYRQAVCQYSQSVVRAPPPGHDDEGDLLSIGFANRSAALLHMGEYALCLRDITAALAAGYPARLRYKLLDRRATCQLKLGEVTASRGTLQELKTALTVADLNEKKMAAWQKDLQNKMDTTSKMQDCKPIMLQAELEQPAPPPLPSRSGHFVSASAAVDVAHAAGEGRYAVAAQHVQPGDVLVVEKPHASVLMAEKMSTHCLHCLKRVLAAFPCAACSGVVFCSPECAAAATYHRWECTILDLLQASGMSVLCHLALRLVTRHSMQFFRELRPELEKRRDPTVRPCTDTEGHTFDPSSYLAVHQLVTLGELRKPEDFFHRTLMAVLLLKHLRVTGYFGELPGG
ncbi:SET and MYND domain-containing protein 4-like [Pollicipes pollicipes]|uniref:SET and MYND domain-containing protein 4-like n=1 Tax=Pollicipes pollicipes TaxID=41117 RepID=UPI001884F17E|nr:SET and MYND domain-containing protein 4-like [Pollicipes pollicipes]XP_037072868.1 SET and MYND domain-containing protein 4-like [Pollicipes pollicipes]